MKKYLVIILIICSQKIQAQDIHFSQLNSSKMMLNPAFTGFIEEDIRLEAKHRSQWITPANPYITTLISLDGKIKNKKESKEDVLAIGGVMMNDNVSDGALESNYFTLNLAYHKILNKNNSLDVLTFGSGVTYGETRLDESLLTFDEQFDVNGFSRLLPNGEQFISPKQANFSISSGLIYSRTASSYKVTIGVGGFNLNKPNLSFLDNSQQQIDRRFVFHSDLSIALNELMHINVNAMYQMQGQSKETLVGGYLNLGFAKKSSLNIGAYHRINESIIPYFGLNLKNVGFGISYDVTTSSLKSAQTKPQTFEASLFFKLMKNKDKNNLNPTEIVKTK